jgi:hypothetical protein
LPASRRSRRRCHHACTVELRMNPAPRTVRIITTSFGPSTLRRSLRHRRGSSFQECICSAIPLGATWRVLVSSWRRIMYSSGRYSRGKRSSDRAPRLAVE